MIHKLLEMANGDEMHDRPYYFSKHSDWSFVCMCVVHASMSCLPNLAGAIAQAKPERVSLIDKLGIRMLANEG